MSSELLDPAETSAKESVKERSGIRGVLIGIAVTAAVLLVAVGITTGHYLPQSNAFRSEAALTGSPVPIDETLDFGADINPAAKGATVTITSIKPIITTNTSKATANVVWCKPTWPHFSGLLAPDAQILNHCDSLAPVEGAKIHFVPNADNIIVRVTPHAYGVVKIAGFEVHYKSGFGNQTQIVGDSFNLTTR
jgi:hypothetical protein